MTLNDQLEALIDAHGLANVVSALGIVCSDKAEHVETTWQDYTLGRAWSQNAIILHNTVTRIKPTA